MEQQKEEVVMQSIHQRMGKSPLFVHRTVWGLIWSVFALDVCMIAPLILVEDKMLRLTISESFLLIAITVIAYGFMIGVSMNRILSRQQQVEVMKTWTVSLYILTALYDILTIVIAAAYGWQQSYRNTCVGIIATIMTAVNLMGSVSTHYLLQKLTTDNL